MKLFPLLFLIIFLIAKIGSEKKKLQQKSFGEIFGEKWKENQEKQRNEEKKREIIQKYYKIKEKIKEKGRKHTKKERTKIEEKITKKLGTNRKNIYQWIKEFGLQKLRSYKSKSDEEKIEIIQKFIKMKNEYKQKGKYSTNEWQQNYAQICMNIGVGIGTIDKWKKQFGNIRKIFTLKEKLEKMKFYWQMKKANPKMSDDEIAKLLKINRANISKWKKQFGEEILED